MKHITIPGTPQLDLGGIIFGSFMGACVPSQEARSPHFQTRKLQTTRLIRLQHRNTATFIANSTQRVLCVNSGIECRVCFRFPFQYHGIQPTYI